MAANNRAPLIPVNQYAMTLDEIAAELGSSKKAVAQILHTALKKLRTRPALLSKARDLAEAKRAMREDQAEKFW